MAIKFQGGQASEVASVVQEAGNQLAVQLQDADTSILKAYEKMKEVLARMQSAGMGGTETTRNLKADINSLNDVRQRIYLTQRKLRNPS